jgi:PAS domain S-box-containing protein
MDTAKNDQRRNTMAYSLSMASLEGNSFPPLTQPLSETQREQIRISALQHHHMRSPWYSEECESRRQNKIGDFATQVGCASKLKQTSSLPQTLQDALRPTSRAIVVTETSKPFRVFNVNKAWEGLCGYSYLESKGRSLGSLLKGEETDQLAVTVMINKLLQGEEATAILTNYTKDGRRFRNRIHVGPLFDSGVESQQPSYFVGVLREV